MGDLSEHFSYWEFQDPHTKVAKVDNRLVVGLELIRRVFGKPVQITSGYRSPEHNREVCGAHHSTHMQGIAADIVIEGVNVWQMYIAAEQVPAFAGGGIGVYPEDGHLHVDVREARARWALLGGEEIGIDQALRRVMS